MSKILVLNPNSNTEVTAAMDRALDPLRFRNGPEIESTTLAEGPFGIESQADVDRTTVLVRDYCAAHQETYDALVIACFSDPGLFGAREAVDKPIFGIAQSGLLTALTLRDRVGVISIMDGSIPRHWRYWRMLGQAERIAGDRAINCTVAELSDEERVLSRMIDIGAQLKEQDGANVLLMGCAGMARYRLRLEERLGIPVVDPTQAAVGLAISRLALRRT